MKTNIVIISMLLLCSMNMTAQDNSSLTTSFAVTGDDSNDDEAFQVSNIISTSAISSLVKVRSRDAYVLKVKVFTMHGDMALEETYEIEQGITEIELHFSPLATGDYIVQFYTQEGSALRKFAK